MSDLSWSYSAYSQALNCLRCFERMYLLGEKPEGPESADLAFGSALHSAINGTLTGQSGPELFDLYWASYKDKPLKTTRYKYEQLKDIGERLSARFESKYAPRFELIKAEERLHAEYAGVKLNGQFDFYGKLDGKLSLLDFKTSAYNYPEEKKLTALQLNLYAYLAIQNGLPAPEQLGYIVLNKGLVTIQQPLVWEFDPTVMDRMLEEMVQYCLVWQHYFEGKTITPTPRNPNYQYHQFNCYGGK